MSNMSDFTYIGIFAPKILKITSKNSFNFEFSRQKLSKLHQNIQMNNFGVKIQNKDLNFRAIVVKWDFFRQFHRKIRQTATINKISQLFFTDTQTEVQHYGTDPPNFS